MLDFIKNILQTQKMCVLATVSNNLPHTSLMAYLADDETRNVYMITHRNTQKYNNLTKRPVASLLVDTRLNESQYSKDPIAAITVTGDCSFIRNGDKIKNIKELFCFRHQHLQEFAEHDEAVIIKIQIKSFQLLKGVTDSYYYQID